MKPLPVFAATAAAALCLISTSLLAGDWPQWRGPQRNGLSTETGLLQEWPKEGPKQVVKITDAGSGYGAPAVVGDRLFLTGNDGLENEFVRAYTLPEGKPLWTAKLGKVGNPDQQPPFPAARSTPTVSGDLVVALGSDGDLVALDSAGGKERWRKNLRQDFGGRPGKWAYSESPLIDGDRIVVTPGGPDASIVALNKADGSVAWKYAAAEGDEAGYASVVVSEAAGVRQYVQLLQKGLAGVDAKSGKGLWRYGRAVSRYGANIPTPVVSGDTVYAASAGTGGGAVRLQAGASGGVEAKELYFEAKLPTAIGGAVKVGDVLFGTTAKSLLCADAATGQVKWEEGAVGAASLMVAEGRLYLHGESGEVALAEASPEGYREKGRFSPADAPKRNGPMEKAWAYPVVANGRLYIREHASVWGYDVRAAK